MGLLGRRRPREAAEAARAMPDTAPCATGTCPDDCASRDLPPREVDIAVTETISGAPTTPTDYSSWNNTYGWQSKYMLTVRRTSCTVLLTMRLKVTGAAITAAQKTAWKTAIENKWNGKVRFVCPDRRCVGACGAGYPVAVEVVYVESGEHYTVTANNPGAAEGGRAGLGGTTSMTGWGVDDLVDITHEFGHMIGAPEEYFTTDGFDYTFNHATRGFRDDGGGNMNNPANDPASRNYRKICEQASLIFGRDMACTMEPPPTQPSGPPAPAPAATPVPVTPATPSTPSHS